MDNKILYLMHMDWDWIKQRPHFLAEGLADQFDVTVLYKTDRHKSELSRNSSTGLRVSGLYTMPYHMTRSLYPVHRTLCRSIVASTLSKLKPDTIWLTNPEMLDYLPSKHSCRIVYDCMDDTQEFQHIPRFYLSRLLTLEKRLLDIASTVFVSSESLARVMSARHECAGKTILVRNAFAGEIVERGEFEARRSRSGRWKISYFGTVAPWFDFDALKHCLDHLPDIEFEIIGPVHGGINVSGIQNERLTFTGPVAHEALGQHVAESACLIMPFHVNELVKSVDPVKLYEYIDLGKPIISVEYDEVKRFDPFVSFYSGNDGLLDTVRSLVLSGFARKYTERMRVQFLEQNSWKQRVDTVINRLNEDGKHT